MKRNVKNMAIKLCAVMVVLMMLVSSLSGCRLIPALNLESVIPDSLGGLLGGSVSADQWNALDAAAISALVHEADATSLYTELVTDAEGDRLVVHDGETALAFNLADGNVSYTNDFDADGRAFIYMAGRFAGDAAALSKIASGYQEHLKLYPTAVLSLRETDADADGETEYLLFINYLLNGASNTLGLKNGDSALDAVFRSRCVCLYLDTDGGDIVYQAVCVDGHGDVTAARFADGVLELTDGNGAISPVRIVEASHVGRVDYSEENFDRLCVAYTKELAARGYSDIRLRRADVTAAYGEEALFCYDNGDGYLFEVVVYYQGRPVTVYSFDATDGGALFLTQSNEQYEFFAYEQDLESTYKQNYLYRIFTINENYRLEQGDSKTVSVNLNTSVDSEANAFFKFVMQRLEKAVVCYDPYELTGYMVMPDGNEMPSKPEAPYLTISNCNTGKSGYVTIKDPGSWLNLREGPSTSYDRTLLDPADRKSYVKQALYSPVTVLAPYNTGDTANPIWVKIQISYMNRTLVGYSSQNFITIPGIQTLRVGERFTVQADTNDSGLRWRSSDTAVAYIDATTGQITARKAGLVLITVTSDSGLEDSCLIKIE